MCTWLEACLALMHQSIETTAPRLPRHSKEVTGVRPWKNVPRRDRASYAFANLLGIWSGACNAWPDREAMGPSNENHASLLRDKMEEMSTVEEKVS